jgi:PAS domain S-box-containing protein
VVERIQAALDQDPVSSPVVLHQLVQTIVADEPAWVLVADANGQLVAASRNVLKLLGYSLEALRALNVTDIGGEDLESVEWLWENFRRQRRQSGGFVLRRRDGTTVRTQYVALSNTVAGLSIAVHTPLDAEQIAVDDYKTPAPRLR